MNKEIELLNNKLDAQDKIINTQALEIARLKEQLENDIDRYEDTISYQLGFDKGKEQLQQENKHLKEQLEILLEDNNQLEEIRIKAIEYIEERFDGEVFTHTFDKCNIRELLAILGEKE